MWFDADIDALDDAHRAPPGAERPRSSRARRWPSALTLAVVSVVALGLLVNIRWRRAARLHHLLLRRDLHDVAEALPTPQNIVIGGRGRRFPPMIGWAAATGSFVVRVDRFSFSSSSSGRRRIFWALAL